MCDKQERARQEKAQQAGCQNPSECKGRPSECSPEQIKKCHGEVKGHPCVKPTEKK